LLPRDMAQTLKEIEKERNDKLVSAVRSNIEDTSEVMGMSGQDDEELKKNWDPEDEVVRSDITTKTAARR